MEITKKKKEIIEVREINIDIAKDGRVETGPVRFGYDWTGLFVRGNDCIMLRELLLSAKEHIATKPIEKLFANDLLNYISTIFGGTND